MVATLRRAERETPRHRHVASCDPKILKLEEYAFNFHVDLHDVRSFPPGCNLSSTLKYRDIHLAVIFRLSIYNVKTHSRNTSSIFVFLL